MEEQRLSADRVTSGRWPCLWNWSGEVLVRCSRASRRHLGEASAGLGSTFRHAHVRGKACCGKRRPASCRLTGLVHTRREQTIVGAGSSLKTCAGGSKGDVRIRGDERSE